MTWFVWMILLVGTAASFSSPINMDWVISGRDRIWWIMKDQPALLKLRDAGRMIRENYEGELMLTQDTYLAVEAGKKVPPGWEMGPFSYYPEMEDEQARTLHLINRKRMLEDIANQPAEVAAFSGYGLSISSPQIVRVEDTERLAFEQALLSHYLLVDEVPGFGQGGTALRVFERTDLSREPR